ncbi:acyl-CoA synthetase [Sulfolobus acidocaldarius SUSAZ]|nr:acyl-CoA synthetase [Sulfolobus acidocaldarius SUSAZ]
MEFSPVYKDIFEAPKRNIIIYYFDEAIQTLSITRHAKILGNYLVERGISRGDRVCIYLQNIPQFLITELATWAIGGIIVPLNIMYKSHELEYFLNDSECKVLIGLETEVKSNLLPILDRTKIEMVITTTGLEYLSQVPPYLSSISRQYPLGADHDYMYIIKDNRELRDVHVATEEELSTILYTSGTTGKPKGAMYTHYNLFFGAMTIKQSFKLDEKDTMAIFSPMSHNIGIVLTATSLISQLPFMIMYRFEPGEALRLIEKWKVSFTLLPATGYISLMNHPDFKKRDLSSFKKLYSGGAPLPKRVVDEWEKLTGVHIRNGYGMTETTGTISVEPVEERAPYDPETNAMSIGKPVPFTEVKIVDSTGKELEPGEVGEIIVRGPHVMKGYWKKPEETAKTIRDGWVYTGDLGKVDKDGWLYYVDRVKDLIIVSGFKVWPREVEDIIYQHPAVKEVAVVGKSDSYRGEIPKAYVVLKNDYKGRVSENDIIEFVKQRLANFKVPREVVFVDELPKTASGKIMRRALKERD